MGHSPVNLSGRLGPVSLIEFLMCNSHWQVECDYEYIIGYSIMKLETFGKWQLNVGDFSLVFPEHLESPLALVNLRGFRSSVLHTRH